MTQVSLEHSTGFPVIKRIELINFMSHRHTVFEPAAGLTVLVGPNNCGKSAVVTALQILCHNDNSTYVLRHDAKECRVIVETIEGDRVEWIRKKRGSPSYLINGKEYDRLNNKGSGARDEIKRILKMPRLEFDNSKFDVHIGEQRNPVFLLGDKGKGAAQFFASSSDASKLVEMQALHKKQVNENRSERKRIAQQQTQVSEALECLDTLPILNDLLSECECGFDSLKTDQQTAKELASLIAELEKSETETRRLSAVGKSLELLNPPPEFSNLRDLESLVVQIQSQSEAIRKSKLSSEVFQTLESPPEFADEARLQLTLTAIRRQQHTVNQLHATNETLSTIKEPPQPEELESISNLAKSIVQLQTGIEFCGELEKELTDANKQLKQASAAIEQWATENPSCPTCGNEVNAEVLIDGGHRHG